MNIWRLVQASDAIVALRLLAMTKSIAVANPTLQHIGHAIEIGRRRTSVNVTISMPSKVFHIYCTSADGFVPLGLSNLREADTYWVWPS